MKTRAAIQVAPGQPLIIDEIELAPPGPTQVVVRQFASGICHTQLHNLHRPDARIPNVLGHESSGVVVAAGAEVSHVKEGDHVVVTWLPRDASAASQKPTAASISYQDRPIDFSGTAGIFTWCETTIEDEQYVVPLDRDIPVDVASILGCAVMTGCGAVLNTARVARGDSVAVFGVGGVGLCIVQACANAGASPIIAVDVADDKLRFAKLFGATAGLNALDHDAAATIRELTGGGVRFAFDAVGKQQSMEQALLCTRPGVRGLGEDGGSVILVGLPQAPVTLPMRALIEGRGFRGSNGGSSRPARDFPLYMQWFREGRLPLDTLVTQRYSLDQINEACAALEGGDILGRAIVTFD